MSPLSSLLFVRALFLLDALLILLKLNLFLKLGDLLLQLVIFALLSDQKPRRNGSLLDYTLWGKQVGVAPLAV